MSCAMPDWSRSIALCRDVLSLLEENRPGPAVADGFAPPAEFAPVCQALGLEGPAAFCVTLSFCCEIDGELRNRLQALAATSLPTLDLALALYCRAHAVRPEALLGLANPIDSPLRLAFEWEEPVRPLFLTPLALRRETMGALLGGGAAGPPFALPDECADWLPVQQPLLDALCGRLSRESAAVLLSGPAGAGRRSLARRAAGALGRPCLSLRCGGLAELDRREAAALPRRLGLLVRLTGALLCLEDCRLTSCELSGLLSELPASHPLVLLGEESDAPAPALPNRTVYRLPVGPLTPDDCDCALLALWGENPPSLERLAPTVGQLTAAWAEAVERAGGRPDGETLRAACREQCPPARLAAPLAPRRLEELTLDGETRARLLLAKRLLSRCHTGDAAKATVLLFGPSGTGKTLAAAALAGEIGAELLRIDLSRLFDKYLGETEKHLSEIFAQAQQRRCILFFDEADALFARRTEVVSSHDRYANLETAHLLQSIELHSGPVLLASNLFKNFDAAFLRRIDLLVRFSLPDAALRLSLWRGALPGDAHWASDVALERLAQELEFSPASIAAVGRNAALLLEEGERLVSPGLLRLLLSNELEKTGQLLDPLLFD